MIIIKACKSIFNGHNLSLIKHNGVCYKEDEVFFIDEDSELAKKIWEHCPNFDFVLKDGNLVDIVAVEHIDTVEELRVKYEALVVSQIRKVYSQDDEYKVFREYLADDNTTEFAAYNTFVTQCKADAYLEVYGEEKS